LLRITAVQSGVHVFQESRMAIYHRWIAALLVSSVLTACASTPSTGAGAAAPPQQAYVTGSHVALPVDPNTGLPETASPLQIVTQDDLNRSGQINLGAALRDLVPALH
jgi:hypothetical protein